MLLRDPLNPAEPALPQTTVFPWVSVMVTIVLFIVAFICTFHADNVLFVFFPPELRDRSSVTINPRYIYHYPLKLAV